MLFAHTFQQAFQHFRLRDGPERRVALQAEAEGLGAAGQVQTPEDFSELLPRLEGMHEATVGDRLALEQLDIPRQIDTVFLLSQGDNAVILEMVVIKGVKAGYRAVADVSWRSARVFYLPAAGRSRRCTVCPGAGRTPGCRWSGGADWTSLRRHI